MATAFRNPPPRHRQPRACSGSWRRSGALPRRLFRRISRRADRSADSRRLMWPASRRNRFGPTGTPPPPFCITTLPSRHNPSPRQSHWHTYRRGGFGLRRLLARPLCRATRRAKEPGDFKRGDTTFDATPSIWTERNGEEPRFPQQSWYFGLDVALKRFYSKKIAEKSILRMNWQPPSHRRTDV